MITTWNPTFKEGNNQNCKRRKIEALKAYIRFTTYRTILREDYNYKFQPPRYGYEN